MVRGFGRSTPRFVTRARGLHTRAREARRTRGKRPWNDGIGCSRCMTCGSVRSPRFQPPRAACGELRRRAARARTFREPVGHRPPTPRILTHGSDCGAAAHGSQIRSPCLPVPEGRERAADFLTYPRPDTARARPTSHAATRADSRHHGTPCARDRSPSDYAGRRRPRRLRVVARAHRQASLRVIALPSGPDPSGPSLAN